MLTTDIIDIKYAFDFYDLQEMNLERMNAELLADITYLHITEAEYQSTIDGGTYNETSGSDLDAEILRLKI
jgi:hypothetical protein